MSIEVKDGKLIDLFKDRDGKPTTVKLFNKAVITVWNIAWGYDMDDEYANITSNISPSIEGATIDFFSTSDVLEISDSESEKILFSKPG
jgi:hypothetical protein